MQRRVVFLLYDGVQPIDVVGPHEVFAAANRVMDARRLSTPRYRLERVAAGARRCPSESGLVLEADGPLPSDEAAIDTIVIPGGDGTRDPTVVGELAAWLADAAPRSRRVATVCSGAFVAAAAGLCDGRRVTTHWQRADELARDFPEVTVDADPIYVRDGDLWTSAGVTAGIDLCLALVGDDCGPEVAQWVARVLIVPLHRAGGQTQFAAPVWSDPPASDPIRAACGLIHQDPAADHTVPRLAGQVGLSPRHFTRRFRTEIGQTPGRYVEAIRIDAARRLLEVEPVGLAEVARRCGFGTSETLRRSFHRRLGLSPDHYRRQSVIS
ncbi:MAG: GlxA family transcriptional regulator [Acidimicrobiia bacterium]|nr:GlxA family transcriptional regulator [Acidimicrobiia bacterium]